MPAGEKKAARPARWTLLRAADQAAVAASDANKCCQANTERMDRMFEKSQRK